MFPGVDLDKWLNHSGYAEATQRNLRADVDALLHHISMGHPERLTAEFLASVPTTSFRALIVAKRKGGAGDGAVTRLLSSIRVYFKWLAEDHGVHNPYIEKLSHPKKKHLIPGVISETSARAVIAASGERDNRLDWICARDTALTSLMYGSGLRLREVLALKTSDLPDMTKTGPEFIHIAGRPVAVMPVTLTALREYLRRCPYRPNCATLFVGARGKPMKAGVVQAGLRALRETPGISAGLTSRTLRNSFGSHLLASGMHARGVQEALGHRDLGSTMRLADTEPGKVLAGAMLNTTKDGG